MNQEFSILTPTEQAAVRRVVSRVREDPAAGQRSEALPDGGEAYAYPGHRGIHWGHNRASDGFCDARGIWPDGQAV
jgi:hypothetical protein